MTIIRTFEDILDVMQENPDLRDAMRQHVRDEEVDTRIIADLDELKSDVGELKSDVVDLKSDVVDLKAGQERMEARQDRMEDRQERMEADIGELKEGQARMEARQDRMEARQDRTEARQERMEARQDRMEADIGELKAGQARLEAGQARLEGRIGDVAGTAYERLIVKRCRSIVRRNLGIQRVKILHSINVVEDYELDSLIEAACEAGVITDGQAYDLDRADIIVSGDGAAGQANYAVIEVSETIDDSDVDRAYLRAATLGRAIGEPVAAAVIGKAVSDANRARAAQSRVAVVIMAE